MPTDRPPSDAAELATAEARAGEAERRWRILQRLVPALSHELGNALNAVTGYLQLVQMDVEPGTEAHDTLDKARAGVERLGRRLSSLTRALRHAEAETVSLSLLLDEAVALAEPTLRRRGVVVEGRWPSMLPDVRGPRGALLLGLAACLLELAGEETGSRVLSVTAEETPCVVTLDCRPSGGAAVAAVSHLEAFALSSPPLLAEPSGPSALRLSFPS